MVRQNALRIASGRDETEEQDRREEVRPVQEARPARRPRRSARPRRPPRRGSSEKRAPCTSPAIDRTTPSTRTPASITRYVVTPFATSARKAGGTHVPHGTSTPATEPAPITVGTSAMSGANSAAASRIVRSAPRPDRASRARDAAISAPTRALRAGAVVVVADRCEPPDDRAPRPASRRRSRRPCRRSRAGGSGGSAASRSIRVPACGRRQGSPRWACSSTAPGGRVAYVHDRSLRRAPQVSTLGKSAPARTR